MNFEFLPRAFRENITASLVLCQIVSLPGPLKMVLFILTETAAGYALLKASGGPINPFR